MESQLSSLYPNESLLSDNEMTQILKQRCRITLELQSLPLESKQLKTVLETLGVILAAPELGALQKCLSLVGEPVNVAVLCQWANTFKRLPLQSLYSLDLEPRS